MLSSKLKSESPFFFLEKNDGVKLDNARGKIRLLILLERLSHKYRKNSNNALDFIPIASLSVRFERWLIRMQPFQATIKYLSGPENGADYLSRHPNTKNICEAVKPTERYVHFIAQNARPIALSAEEMEEETEKDKECQMIKEALKTGKWHKLNENTRKAFEKIADEISITPGGLILKGARIFVPSTLQDRVIELAHEGHQGIVRTKQLLRWEVWFPKMDSAVEKAIIKCFACQAATTTKIGNQLKCQLCRQLRGQF